MKKMIVLLLVTVLTLALGACAPKQQEGKTRIKCPACGYEFEAPK